MTNIWLYYICFVLTIGISCGMICFYKRCRKVPLNYILLGSYTVVHSYLVAALCTMYSPETILAAAACTTAMFIALTAYACFTKTDFTYFGGFISVCSLMFFVFWMLFAFYTRKNSVFYLILLCLGVCLMSFWIIYDTQLVVGQKKKGYTELELDDYCLGALIIYTDILTLFLYVLQLFGSGNWANK